MERLGPEEQVGEEGVNGRENDQGGIEDTRGEAGECPEFDPVGLVDVRMLDLRDDALQGLFLPEFHPVDVLDGGQVQAHGVVILRIVQPDGNDAFPQRDGRPDFPPGPFGGVGGFRGQEQENFAFLDVARDAGCVRIPAGELFAVQPVADAFLLERVDDFVDAIARDGTAVRGNVILFRVTDKDLGHTFTKIRTPADIFAGSRKNNFM